MSVSASGKGGLMLRCDPDDSERLLAEPGASRMEMRGKEMDGWLRVTSDAVADDAVLQRWVDIGTSYAASLPRSDRRRSLRCEAVPGRASKPLQGGHPSEPQRVLAGLRGSGAERLRASATRRGDDPTIVPLRTARVRSRLTYALFGVLATLTGMAAGHLVASLLDPASSPVLAVGSQVIDLTPTPLKEWAIRHFGSNDKRVLVGSVLAGTLVLSAVAGLLARRRFRYGAGLLVLLVAVAAFTALNRPAAELTDVVPSIVAAVVGTGALWLLVRPADDITVIESGGSAAGPSRRGLLITAAAVAGTAALMGEAGRLIGHYRQRLTDIAFPKPGRARGAVPDRRRGPLPRHHATARQDRRLLPRRHPARRTDRRHRRLVADDRRDGRPRARAHLRRPPRDALDRARHHAHLRLQQRRRSLRRRRPLARRPAHRPARAGGRAGRRRPDLQYRRRRHDDRHAVRARHRRPRRDDRDRHERRAAPARARLPGPHGGPRALRLRQRLQVDRADHADDVRRARLVLDQARLGHPCPDQGLQPDRHTQGARRPSTPATRSSAASPGRSRTAAWPVSRSRSTAAPGRTPLLGPTAGNDYWRQWYLPWTAESGTHHLAAGSSTATARPRRRPAWTRSPRAPAASRHSS